VMRGRVDWYSAALGYGFIIPGDGSTKVLVRDADIEGDGPSSLANGDEVTYETLQGREGIETTKVSKYD
jgi:cold shock protein